MYSQRSAKTHIQYMQNELTESNSDYIQIPWKLWLEIRVPL